MALVKSQTMYGGSAGGTTTAIDTTGVGVKLLVIVLCSFNGSTPSISDSASNTLTPLPPYEAGDHRTRIYYTRLPNTSATHTWTVSGTGVYTVFTALLFDDDVDYASIENGTAGGEAYQIYPGPVTPIEDNSVIVTGVTHSSGSASTINGGFTTVGGVGTTGAYVGGGAAYLIQTTAAVADPEWNTGFPNPTQTAAIAVFSPSAAGATTLTAEAGTINFNGQSVGFKLQATASNGLITFTGQDVSFTHEQPGVYVLAIDPGTITFSAPESYSALAVGIEPGTVTFSGQDVTGTLSEPTNYSLSIDPGTINFNGRNVGLYWSGAPTGDNGKIKTGVGIGVGIGF